MWGTLLLTARSVEVTFLANLQLDHPTRWETWLNYVWKELKWVEPSPLLIKAHKDLMKPTFKFTLVIQIARFLKPKKLLGV